MQQPPPITKASRTRWWIHLLLVTAYVVYAGLSGMNRKANHTPILHHDAWGLLFVCAAGIALFALVLGLACWSSKATADDLLLKWRGGPLPVFLGIGYSIAVRLAIAIVTAVVFMFLLASRVVTSESLQTYVKTHKPDSTTLIDISALTNDPAYYWLTITLASFVVAGLREELWRSAFLAGLRKLWPGTFGSTAGQVGAVCVAAVFFGAAHLSQGAMGAVLTGLIGLALGLIMVFHRSIWPAVIAHGCFDAASFALLAWTTSHGLIK